MKRRKAVPKPAPFMNKELRKAVYKNRMLHNKFLKCKSDKNWEEYRKQRNYVTKIKIISMRDVQEDLNLVNFGRQLSIFIK